MEANLIPSPVGGKASRESMLFAGCCMMTHVTEVVEALAPIHGKSQMKLHRRFGPWL